MLNPYEETELRYLREQQRVLVPLGLGCGVVGGGFLGWATTEFAWLVGAMLACAAIFAWGVWAANHERVRELRKLEGRRG